MDDFSLQRSHFTMIVAMATFPVSWVLVLDKEETLFFKHSAHGMGDVILPQLVQEALRFLEQNSFQGAEPFPGLFVKEIEDPKEEQGTFQEKKKSGALTQNGEQGNAFQGSMNSIQSVVSFGGPGPFTALRVSKAFAEGFSFGCPVMPPLCYPDFLSVLEFFPLNAFRKWLIFDGGATCHEFTYKGAGWNYCSMPGSGNPETFFPEEVFLQSPQSLDVPKTGGTEKLSSLSMQWKTEGDFPIDTDSSKYMEGASKIAVLQPNVFPGEDILKIFAHMVAYYGYKNKKNNL